MTLNTSLDNLLKLWLLWIFYKLIKNQWHVLLFFIWRYLLQESTSDYLKLVWSHSHNFPKVMYFSFQFLFWTTVFQTKVFYSMESRFFYMSPSTYNGWFGTGPVLVGYVPSNCFQLQAITKIDFLHYNLSLPCNFKSPNGVFILTVTESIHIAAGLPLLFLYSFTISSRELGFC